MPNRCKRACRHPGCGAVTDDGLCAKHRELHSALAIAKVKQKSDFYGPKWRRESKRFLEENPWCAMHLENGEHVRATVTDHRIPHRGNLSLFWDRKNWQPLCKSDHDRKTATIDTSFAFGY
jgi:5-methylcytosine-specific restriction protein A